MCWCVSSIQTVFQWCVSADPHGDRLHRASSWGQPCGLGTGQPRGTASADGAVFWSVAFVSGHRFWDSPAASKWAAGEWLVAHAGSGVGRCLEMNSRPCAERWCWAWAGELKLLSATTPHRAGCHATFSRRTPTVWPPSPASGLPLLWLPGLRSVCC